MKSFYYYKRLNPFNAFYNVFCKEDTMKQVKVKVLDSCIRPILLTYYFPHSSLNCCENDTFQLANFVKLFMYLDDFTI